MGLYLNKGNTAFREIRNRDYIDKSGMIAVINDTIDTYYRCTCVTRPRRFGKSFAAKMLCAYYDKSCDSSALFDDLEIAKDPGYKEHLNKYNVIYLCMTDFIVANRSTDVVAAMEEKVVKDLSRTYECLDFNMTLPEAMETIYLNVREKFIFIIDEWDAFLRDSKISDDSKEEYLNLLRVLFKGGSTEEIIAAVYMTGILPIKKYGSHSALSDFNEYDIMSPDIFVEYTGFTEKEVKILCRKHNMNFEEMRAWYDGYEFKGVSALYNPSSVMQAIRRKSFGNYWKKSETINVLKHYINMNFDGLKDSIINLLAGEKVDVEIGNFNNDISEITSKDDALTLLIHLGYLACNVVENDTDTVLSYIPNREIMSEFKTAVKNSSWGWPTRLLQKSDDVIRATFDRNAKSVANLLDDIHMDQTSNLTYNNEESLYHVIAMAYLNTDFYYTKIRELPTGKGFADIAFLPVKNTDKPAMLVELKYDKTAEGAIQQIKEKNYVQSLEHYKNNLLLVGINYDKKTKKHECIIEKYSEV